MAKNNHPEIKPFKISGKLTAKVPQHFSYVVCQVGDDEKYYELKPNYHKDFPPTVLFKQWWRMVSRVFDVDLLLEKRARNIFGRAGIKPLRVKYFTTYHSIKGKNGTGLTRQRHLIGVRLTPFDFEGLRKENYLRETSLSKVNLESSDLKIEHVYDLIPFMVYRERMLQER